ncbi:MAG TPA: hypothetical protein VGO93_02200 [Candidatus Xenobia bacterium]|jgi:hypothetical protein
MSIFSHQVTLNPRDVTRMSDKQLKQLRGAQKVMQSAQATADLVAAQDGKDGVDLDPAPGRVLVSGFRPGLFASIDTGRVSKAADGSAATADIKVDTGFRSEATSKSIFRKVAIGDDGSQRTFALGKEQVTLDKATGLLHYTF